MFSRLNGMNTIPAQLGKVIRASAIEAVRAQCPIGSKHLVYLGFTYNSGDKSYQHNFNGVRFRTISDHLRLRKFLNGLKGLELAGRIVIDFK